MCVGREGGGGVCGGCRVEGRELHCVRNSVCVCVCVCGGGGGGGDRVSVFFFLTVGNLTCPVSLLLGSPLFCVDAPQ